MTKTIWILAIATAFVAGTVTTGTFANAQVDAEGVPLQQLQQQINDIINGIISVGSIDWDNVDNKPLGFADNVDDVDDADNNSANELQTLSGTGQVALSDGGGTVSCADITGSAGLCDGVDDVDDADNDDTNELQTLSVGSDITLSQGGGSVSCEDITGGAGLCDGVDNVGEAFDPTSLENRLANVEGILDSFNEAPIVDAGPNHQGTLRLYTEGGGHSVREWFSECSSTFQGTATHPFMAGTVWRFVSGTSSEGAINPGRVIIFDPFDLNSDVQFTQRNLGEYASGLSATFELTGTSSFDLSASDQVTISCP